MKTKTRLGRVVTLTATLFATGLMNAQDTVIIKEESEQTTSDNRNSNPDMHYVELGAFFLPTFSSFDVRTYNGDIVQGKATLSMGYGAKLGINISNNVGFQGEVNYNKMSQRYKDQELERNIHIDYVNIPLLLSLNTDKAKAVNLNFVAGPQFGINVGSNTSVDGSREADTLRAVVAVKQNDFGFAYGAGLEIMLNPSHRFRLDLGYRGFYGLVKIDDKSSGDTYNVIVHASRKTNAAYAGLSFLF